ncbi:MAG: MMPL family transporter [Bacteroidales bacterium]|nr:MMPL family transporter [Bacteroidales bacterium]
MWNKIADYIMNHRVLNLVIASVLLLFLGLNAFTIKMGYNLANTLPETDSTMVVYRQFLDKYGPDGRAIFIGMVDEKLFDLPNFQDYYDLNENIRKIEGVTECLSVTRVYNIVKNDSIKKFQLSHVVGRRPQTQKEVDSIKSVIESLAMYDGLLFNTETHSTMMLVTLDDEHSNTNLRKNVTDVLSTLLNDYSTRHGIEMHVSGMPYIREITTQKMVKEIVGFTFLSIVVAGLILYLFFRSWRPLVSVMTIVLLSVIYMFGIMALLDFDVTILTGVLPPLLIIIGVENSIFMLNKYHREFDVCHDKIQALKNVIVRIGPANLLTNTTTAVSFASFIITRNALLVPFGILASICIMLTYVMTMVLLPTFFSYQKKPEGKMVNYMNNPRINYIMDKISVFVLSKKRMIFSVLAVLMIICVIGALRITTSGRVVDDIAKSDKLYKDIMFFEENVGGVMPFEISIDTRKPKGIMNAPFIRKVQQLEDTLALYPEFSEPLSIAEVVKFARQGFYNGKREQFKIPSNNEFGFIMKYMPETKGGDMPAIVTQYMDKEMQCTRVSVQMANVTTPEIDAISRTLKPQIDQIFPKEKYDVVMTGSAMVTLQGTNYLIVNLSHSLFLAFIVIALLMAITFHKLKMVVISLIPNLIPLLFTAGVMGFCGIPLKMSTILVFSIALGISVDNTIHYLARYRLQMKMNDNDIKKSVMAAIQETGPSMIYSASILICGFLIFAFSSFGGTKIVGFLVPFTLLIALITNILVLPALVLTFYKKKL